MARKPIHRDDRPFNALEGFVSGLLAGAASFVPLVLIRVTEFRDLELFVWLGDRPPLAAAYVAAAIAVPVAVAARYQPQVAGWVGIGVIVGLPSAFVAHVAIWWDGPFG